MELAVSSVTVNEKLTALSSVLAVHGDRKQRTRRTNNSVHGRTEMGRRGILLSIALASSSAAVAPEINDSKSAILQKYLKKSEENKAKNDKERLDGYYKRNYKDYFEFLQGSFEGKSEQQLTESEKGILDWLRANRK
ncbi:Photosystem I PsaN [Macleaya cordata]|uniref:Photosystem I PsaN n=1 Tax=Macleaya cordata TaxID=56857 RepID=A0A200Q662_MACCD|nr:Photosystem I PsaN [Macleaya cordata]